MKLIEKFNVGKPVELSLWQLNAIVSMIYVAAYNVFFWKEITQIIKPNSINDYQLMAAVILLLFFVFNGLLSLVTFRFTTKPILAALFILSSISLYFISQYNIVIDGAMIRNVIETNASEAKDLMGIKLFLYVIFLGILPTVVLLLIKINLKTTRKLILNKVKVLVVSVMAIGIIIYANYPSFASIARSNHHLSHMILPTNYVFGSITYIQERFNKSVIPFNDISQGASLQGRSNGKEVIILIAGETARADRFSLNGYQNETNPNLKLRSLINFKQTSSCGTSTAVSLPCLFSHLDRKSYNHKEGKNSANLLDFLAQAGFDVQWRDNNTGCKGICNRVDYLDLSAANNAEFCSTGECFDEILLTGLSEQIKANPNNQFIVLHQKGSHGPAYYLRYPAEFEKFRPTCKDILLQNCSSEELDNAYNNTILYTDHFINETIHLLESLPTTTSVNLIYISDHGESLGENNLYLHGTPYLIAPEEQTHVPFFYWTRHTNSNDMFIDTTCLKSKENHPASHDNLFHSILGLSGVSTTYYDPGQDLFGSCTNPNMAQFTADLTME